MTKSRSHIYFYIDRYKAFYGVNINMIVSKGKTFGPALTLEQNMPNQLDSWKLNLVEQM